MSGRDRLCVGLIVFALIFIVAVFTKLEVCLSYADEDFTLVIRWLFVKIHILPSHPKKKKKLPKKTKQGEKKETRRIDPYAFLRLVRAAARDVPHRLNIKQLSFCAAVGGKRASDTAIAYGRMQIILYTLYGLMEQTFRIGSSNIQVGLDFENEKSSFDFQMILFSSVGSMILFLIHLLCAYIQFNKNE